MNKVFSKEEIREKYDAFARYYDFFEGIFELFVWRYRRRLLSLARGNVLEVGIGTGKSLKYYPSNADIMGIDASREMLKKARKKARALRMNVAFIQGDAQCLPFGNKRFDSVVDTLGLCTYSNPIKVLREMRRVCKDNGIILLLEHGVSNQRWVRGLQERGEKNHYEKLGCSLLREHEALVRNAGLKIVKAERKLFGAVYIIVARR